MTHRDQALGRLRADRELTVIAATAFGFDLGRTEHVEEVVLASGVPIQPIAGEDAGGTYFRCAGGEVLYADSEGRAGLIADSVDEALETVIGLPGCLLYAEGPRHPDADLPAVIAEVEGDVRGYAPDLAEHRRELLAALGLPDRPRVELIHRLWRGLLRTEPDFLLLNAAERTPYELLDEQPRPPLWRTMLDEGPGGTPVTWAAAAAELGVAAPGDPAAVPPVEWAKLARRWGRTERARVILLRLVSGAGPRDGELFGQAADELEALGDPLAAYARRMHLHLTG